MTVTAREKLKALKLVRQEIADEHEMFMCSALNELCRQNKIRPATRDQLRAYILAAIYPHPYYSGWARENGVTDIISFRDGRLAWLDWMIEGLEEQCKP